MFLVSVKSSMVLISTCMHVYVGNWTQSPAHAKHTLYHEAIFPIPRSNSIYIYIHTYMVIIWWFIFLVNLTGFSIAMGTDIWGCLREHLERFN